MPSILPVLTDEEIRQIVPPDELAGFGALETPRGLLPLKALDVQARVEGLLAEVAVWQTFVNTLDQPVEATYIFPLPDRAAVTRFRMEVAGRVVEGILKERGEAREEYEQATRQGYRAAIAEEDRAGVFTLRVGNVLPGECATIRLNLTEWLPYDSGEVTFRFPLVVAPRYIPGLPLEGPSVGDGVAADTDAVPDASRITPPVLLPGFADPVRLSLGVELATAGLELTEVRSSLHAVSQGSSPNRLRIVVQPSERLNRDFILRFRVGARQIQTSLVLQPDAENAREGTFALTLIPPAAPVHRPRPRDLVFVLDRSGSMGGWKMVAARRALGRMIDTLTAQDRFTVYAFDNVIETPPAFQGGMLVAATNRNRFRAVEFLARLEARNGTELAQPLAQAVRQLQGDKHPGERERILVLVTDGQVGNEDQILRELSPHVRGQRIFTLGIDQAVNAAFLRRLATLGGGLCELVESEDRLDEVLDKIHQRIGMPVLTAVQVEPTFRVESGTLVPRRMPDLFPGQPLVLLGRYTGNLSGALTIQARDAAGRTWSTSVPAQRGDNPALPTVWARGQVRELEDRYVTHSHEQAELEKQIIQTSLRHGVLCRFTAFVAVDVRETVNPQGVVHRVTQPVEAAAGWAMLGTDQLEQFVYGGFDARRSLRSNPSNVCKARGILLDQMLGGGSFSNPAYSGVQDKDTFAAEAACVEFDPEVTSSSPQTGTPGSSQTRPRRKGLFQKLRQSLGGGDRNQHKPKTQDHDLSAYEARAHAMLDLLQVPATADVGERLTRLGMLAVQLAALAEDLKSIDAPGQAVRPLDDLLQRLQGLLSAASPHEKEIADLWTDTAATLHQFGDKKEKKRGRRFWK